jgi:hypothetical protein
MAAGSPSLHFNNNPVMLSGASLGMDRLVFGAPDYSDFKNKYGGLVDGR